MAGATNRDFDAEVLARIAEGESLREICRSLSEKGCPTASRFTQRVLAGDEPFATLYVRARELQAEAWADEILRDAEDSSKDTTTRTDRAGNEYDAPDHEWIARSRLIVDTKKWLLSKLKPGKYGEKLAVTGAEGGPLVVQWQSAPGASVTTTAAPKPE